MKAEAAKQGNWFQRAFVHSGHHSFQSFQLLLQQVFHGAVVGLLEALRFVLPSDLLIYSKNLNRYGLSALPALVVWSRLKCLGGNQTIGIVLGLMLISGSLPNAWGSYSR